MPKRIGHVYEDIITLSNCIAAEKDMVRNKIHNKQAMMIRECPEYYGEKLYNMLKNDEWQPDKYKTKIIIDGYHKKERNIKIPSLKDQAVHHAVMRITVPYIENRNYFYNCGSIPGAGQTRAITALQNWLSEKHSYKYGETLDIRKFFDTCPHKCVMNALRRIFKDEKFLKLHETILNNMSDNDIGLAIGFYPSQWYANLVLMKLDYEIKENFHDIKFVRYMDDYALISNNKRKLHQARKFISTELNKMGLQLKDNWQVFKISERGISFLGFRFFHGYTTLKKCLMYRIYHKCKYATNHFNAHTAAGVVSYMGLLKWCNSYNFRKVWIYPMVSINKCKEMISNASKNAIYRSSCNVSN